MCLKVIFSYSLIIPDGVPQGNILGPSLFSCYINNILHVNFPGYLNLYADDPSIRVSANSVEILVSTLNSDLKIILDWSICNTDKLTVNFTILYEE